MLSLTSKRPWFLLAALQLADITTTAIALNTRSATEANPTARSLMSSFGQPLAYSIKAAAVVTLLFALYQFRTRAWSRVLLWVAIAVSLYAVVNNTGFLLSAHP